jgi:hypothetical protein
MVQVAAAQVLFLQEENTIAATNNIPEILLIRIIGVMQVMEGKKGNLVYVVLL